MNFSLCSLCRSSRNPFINLKCSHNLCLNCYRKSKNENKLKNCHCGAAITIFNFKNKINKEKEYIQCGFICENIFPSDDKCIQKLKCQHSICNNCEQIYNELSQKNEFKNIYCPYLDCKNEFEKDNNPHEKIEPKIISTECPVCNKEMTKKSKVVLDCKHFLCKQCLKESIENLSQIPNRENNKLSCYVCGYPFSNELLERIFHSKFIQEKPIFNLFPKDSKFSQEKCPQCRGVNTLIQYAEYFKKNNIQIENYEFQTIYKICEFDKTLVCDHCHHEIPNEKFMKTHFLFESKF